jgi:hypothetical protein
MRDASFDFRADRGRSWCFDGVLRAVLFWNLPIDFDLVAWSDLRSGAGTGFQPGREPVNQPKGPLSPRP